MSLTEKINEDLKQAMKNQDQGALRAMRSIKSALLIAQTEKGADDVISEDRELKLLQKLVKQRKESLEIFQSQNRQDLADKETEELKVIEKYLPQQMGEAELKLELQKIIEETGAKTSQEMGKVMGVASKKLMGKADGKTISAMVQNLLKAK